MNEIFELVTYGGGGYTWQDVYNMPTQVRKFNLKRLIQDKEAQAEAQKKANTKGQSMTMKDLVNNSSGKKPDYTSKASRK
jgi:hypothetical protein